MRLTEFEVSKIVHRIYLTWKNQKLIEPISSEGEVILSLEEIFLKNLQEEDALNAEVQKMVDQLIAKSPEELDQRKLFQLVKNQLIKDRKLVI
ncbi:MAG: DUF507 family protein [Bdellovibrionales bacterium]|nr:DUF507 family protein [Bdellovibrionales bacterium]